MENVLRTSVNNVEEVLTWLVNLVYPPRMLEPVTLAPLSRHEHGRDWRYQDAQFFLESRHVHGETMILRLSVNAFHLL